MKQRSQPDHVSALGRLIRERRERLGLSLRQLEELSGINNSTLNRLETGRYATTNLAHFDTLATALEITTQSLYRAAGLTRPPTGLPPLPRYLKARYGDRMTPAAWRELHDYLHAFQQRHGLTDLLPRPGHDELPEGETPPVGHERHGGRNEPRS